LGPPVIGEGEPGHYKQAGGEAKRRGARAGCLIGRHEANKRAREQTPQSQGYNTSYRTR